ncbi:MAG: M36 family metallopeptidase [Lewinellaceae bacterium]|nr:M36 family metallopeptidase [Saprospiraceae bacterium]MCB9342051.1 M36 family metallopeptidase [Lewinellaceae bacterium]
MKFLLPLICALFYSANVFSQVLPPPSRVMEYLQKNAQQLGLQLDDLSEVTLTDQHTSRGSGIEHLYLRQSHAGIEVFGANMTVNIGADGRVLYVGNRFLPNYKNRIAGGTTPQLTAEAAILATAEHLGYQLKAAPTVIEMKGGATRETVFSQPELSSHEIPVKLMWQPAENGDLRLAWDLHVKEPGILEWWSLRVDAETGEVLSKVSWVSHCSFHEEHEDIHEAQPAGKTPHITQEKVDLAPNPAAVTGGTYNVFPPPVESPYFGDRTIVTDPANATASPFGWHDTDGVPGAEYTITRGNNVYAQIDDDSDVETLGASPDGGASLVFDFPLDLNQEPRSFEDASCTNNFFWNNILHDVLYLYGFDEQAGNFQANNYGNGGLGDDYVISHVQPCCNNAGFGTPPDGMSGVMNLRIFTTPNPRRDATFNQIVVAHEYGHGLHTRLTGGPANSGCYGNAEEMGEGIADFVSLMFTIKPGDEGTDSRRFGNWVLGLPTTGPGFRQLPYSTDLAVNSSTYNSIKTNVNVGGYGEPHSKGNVWTAMLWEMAWALIDAHGFNPDIYDHTSMAGNIIALNLFVEGLKMQPCSPGFVDARDAILAADTALYGGANSCLIWQAFAKRGLGFSADQGDSNDRLDGTEAFDVPPGCGTVCHVYQSQDVPVTIPELGSVTSQVNIPSGVTISDVNLLGLAIDHNYINDLRVKLKSPSNTERTLLNQICGGDQNILLSLDDESPNPYASIPCPPNGGDYQPFETLSAFDGESSNGDWVLTIDDLADEDGGQLTAWTLEVCADFEAGDCAIANIRKGPTPPVCDPVTMTYSQQVSVFYYTGAANLDSLVVNGQKFEILSSPQIVTLTNLPANGLPVDVTVSFTGNPGCSMTANNLFTAPCCRPEIVYVDADATGANDGTSWADAYVDLQDGLTAAVCGDVTQVWVAAGTYKPTAGTDRSATFALLNGKAIYGGFAGTETELGERNWVANVTTLSGDIGTPGDSTDNSYRIVTGQDIIIKRPGPGHPSLTSVSVLDGFVITGANNDLAAPADRGGGMLLVNSSPEIFNCVFTGNYAAIGGGVHLAGSSPYLANCAFTGNSAIFGGGMWNAYSSSPSFMNCTFAGNSATVHTGGLLNSFSANAFVVNSIFWGNNAPATPDFRNELSATSTISYTLLEEGACPTDAVCGDGMIYATDPLFVSTTDLHLQECSPAKDVGIAFAAPETDFDGGDRPQGNGVDMGFDENGASCTCPDDRTLSGILPSATYQAGMNLGADALVKKDREVSFKAGTGILLDGIFEVELGALFEAIIEACTPFVPINDEKQ